MKTFSRTILLTLWAVSGAIAGCSLAPPVEHLGVLHNVEAAPDVMSLPDAVELEAPFNAVDTVPLLEDFEAGPEVGELPDAVTLEELDCAPIDPIEALDFGPDLFMRSAFTETLFTSEEAVRLSLGVGVVTRWASCRDSGERCLYERFQTESVQVEERPHLFVSTFSRCTGCDLACDLEPSGAWASEFRFESAALEQGTYEVIVDSAEALVMGFVVDDEAARIVESWSDSCLDLGACRPHPVTVTTPPRRVNARGDQTVELDLRLEVPFRCPTDGVVTEVAWRLSGDRIEPVVYAVEPAVGTCEGDRGEPTVVERTLSLDTTLLGPGTFTVEHGGEVVTTLVVR